MLNLNDLQIFVQVVDHGGFTAAGRALKLPKQTLSKRVAELEHRAGVRLIQRSSRSFAVTELGLELYQHASAMVVEAQAAENIILRRLAEPSGTVRITASIVTVTQDLAPLLPQLAATYPKILIMLTASDRFVDVVQEGFDIAIRDHFNELPDSGLMQRRVGTESFWLVASPKYLENKGELREPADIVGLDGLFSAQTESGWTLYDRSNTGTAVILKPRYYANESTALLAAASAGLGIACLPASLCGDALEKGGLRRVLSDWTAGGVTTTLLMPHRRGLLPSVRVVADTIIDHLSRK